MSHVVEIATQVRDEAAVQAACRRLGLPEPHRGSFRLFGAEVAGLGVQFPGWRYPAVCDTASGQIRCDTFEGRWGDPQQLQRFLQAYAIEKARLEARRQGHTLTEQPLTDGSVKLTIHVGGHA